MTATAPESTALYDVPGPRTRQRHRLYAAVSTALILALVGSILYLLFDTDQFTYTKWMPFEYKGIQELLLRGLGNTLKAFAMAAVLSLALGTVLATGRLSDHRPVRWVSALVVGLPRHARTGDDLLHLRGTEGAAAARAGSRGSPSTTARCSPRSSAPASTPSNAASGRPRSRSACARPRS